MSKTSKTIEVAVLGAAVAVLVALVLTLPGTGHRSVHTREAVARTPAATHVATSGARLTSSKPSSVTVVSGVLGFWGGVLAPNPLPRCGCTPAAGTVRLTSVGGHRIYVKTTKSGRFSVRLSEGRYRVVGGLNRPSSWSMGSCRGLSGDGVRFDRSKHVSYLTVGKENRMTVYVGCESL